MKALADVLLAAAVQRRTLAVIVEPGNDGHDVLLETAEGMSRCLTVPAREGDAVVARVALVAGLDVAAPAGQLGRVTVSLGSSSAELMTMTFRRGERMGFEVRRLVGMEDATALPARGRTTPPRDIPIAGGGVAPAPDAPVAVSDRLGSYRLIARLGEGGMGTVFRGEHVALGKRVAIKVLHADVARDPRLSTTLLREGRLASRAHHPGIVDVTDFGTTHDGRTYLVMELVTWPTLRQLLVDGPLEARRALSIARQILAALEAAHVQGVVHRDLKPANVFVGPDDAVKLGDFGTARALRPGESGVRDTRENTVSGSPHYMSPEHCRGQLTDGRTDIYAVGCILFEMLTGMAPFEGENAVAVMMKQVNDPVPPLIVRGVPVPEPVVRVVTRAMAKSADRRYQAAALMIAELERAEQNVTTRGGWPWPSR